MRHLALVAFAGCSSWVFADLPGSWKGVAILGQGKVAVPTDGDGLVKLQLSKAFLKGIRYEFDLAKGGTFVSRVRVPESPVRNGKGNWAVAGESVVFKFIEDNGKPSSLELKGKLSADRQTVVIVITGKNDYPDTKIILSKK
jgi:hypothetical protein